MHTFFRMLFLSISIPFSIPTCIAHVQVCLYKCPFVAKVSVSINVCVYLYVCVCILCILCILCMCMCIDGLCDDVSSHLIPIVLLSLSLSLPFSLSFFLSFGSVLFCSVSVAFFVSSSSFFFSFFSFFLFFLCVISYSLKQNDQREGKGP